MTEICRGLQEAEFVTGMISHLTSGEVVEEAEFVAYERRGEAMRLGFVKEVDEHGNYLCVYDCADCLCRVSLMFTRQVCEINLPAACPNVQASLGDGMVAGADVRRALLSTIDELETRANNTSNN